MDEYFLVQQDSPLRRLPDILEPRQRIALDGIRYAAEMVGLGFVRLMASLEDISSRPRSSLGKLPFVQTFADAWLIVDAANRIRPLLLAFPGGQEAKFVKWYLEQTDGIRRPRDGVQHLEGRLDRLVAKKEQAWGTLTWVTVESRDPLLLRTHALGAGTVQAKQEYPMENPLGKALRSKIDLVTLHAHEQEVDLVEAFRTVKELVDEVERQLVKQVSDLPGTMVDIYASAEIRSP